MSVELNVKEMTGNSRFLKKEDVVGKTGKGILVTIRDIDKMNVGDAQTQQQDLKFVVYFNELKKPLVLNKTSANQIAAITGSDKSSGWIGKQVVLFNDATVMFKGECKGGIRVRAPVLRNAPAPAPVVKPEPIEEIVPVNANLVDASDVDIF